MKLSVNLLSERGSATRGHVLMQETCGANHGARRARTFLRLTEPRSAAACRSVAAKQMEGNSSDGFALIIVMLAIFVLASMAAYLAFAMKVETKLAVTAGDDQKMIWLARSAVEEARWGLAQEKTIPNQQYTALNQWWATGVAGPFETNSVLVGVPQSIQLGDGTATYKIIDLERYANINVAPTPLLQQALTVMGVDADEVSIVSDSIQDWVQAGDSPRIAGAKNDYYQSLNPPYNCKEAPIDDMSELLLVRGIADDPAIYYGGSLPNIPASRFQHQLGFAGSPGEQPPQYPFGLKDVFTPFSTGQININTADANTLQIIPGVDTNTVAAILQYRAGPSGDATGPDATPFQNVGQLSAAGISPAAAQAISRYCTTSSSTFKVIVTATIAQDTRTFYAILFQAGAKVEVVDFYWDE